MTEINNDPHNFFSTKVDQYTVAKVKLKKRIRNISILRVLVFLISSISFYLGVAYGSNIVIVVALLGSMVFVYLVKVHLSLEKSKNWNDALLIINQSEIDLLEGKESKSSGGKEFLSSNHHFAEDLDIFGKKSVFQLINRSSTAFGKDLIANRLNNPILNLDHLKRRQEAISELSKMSDWRQRFQATGFLFSENKHDQTGILNWSKSNAISFNKWQYRLLLVINPIIGFGVIALIQMKILTVSAFFMFLIIPFIIVGTRLNVLNKIHSNLSKKSTLFLKYSELFNIISNRAYTSELLNSIKTNVSGQKSAHKAIKNLSSITKSMDYRLNMLVGFFLNIFFLWDIRSAIKIERWKSKYAPLMDDWFSSLSLIDDLQSFAGFSFIFQDGIFPELTNGSFKLKATNVKHPFITKKKSVGNPVNFNGWNEFHIITGANMAGKSTYLRTIGVNMVLAMTGCVVLADSFVFTPTNIFTGIKTTDSLQDGESYFFAELKRLKELIMILEEGHNLFVILDEVLRGTNSADKQKGSMALITQLLNLNASGIIATHDLALGTLKDEFPENITNKRFEVEIANNQLVFDYKLKSGISENLNATFLMKKMGITI